MELLINTSWFQTLVRDARKISGIPKDGHNSHTSGKISTYVLLNDKESWNWPNKDLKKYSGKEREFYKILNEIFIKSGLPYHFEKAIKSYIYYNRISVPGTDFLINVNESNASHPIALPQVKLFQRLDIKNINFMSWLIRIISNRKQFSLLQTRRLDPKKELNEKLSFLNEIKLLEKGLKKYYPIVKDEDVATAYLDKKGTTDNKSYSDKNIQKLIKRIRNTRQYVANVYKERGIPLN